MTDRRTVRVYSPDEKMFADINNIPRECTAKEFIEAIVNIKEFANLEKNFKIKCDVGYLADDDILGDDIIYLAYEEDALPKSKKDQKILVKGFFWGLQFATLLLIIFHKALYGAILYIFGSVFLWVLKQLNPENDNLAADIIDGIRLFFVSLMPDFYIGDAAKKQD